MDVPKKGNLCRRVRWGETITIKHGGETVRIRVYKNYHRDGSLRHSAVNLVFNGPRTFAVFAEDV